MRLEVTRRADLATRALVELERSGGRLKGAALAERLGASAGFLAQAMTPLVGQGWVRSEPGPTGGYVLTATLTEVNLLDVIEAVEGPTDTNRCVVEDRPCNSGAPCALHQPWSRARTRLVADLARTRVSRLGASRGRG
jgi:Rrf2 family protein